MSDTPLVEMRGISKYYPGVVALDNVDFSLARGEVHALVGENGAGKSTLMKILAGAEPKSRGEILLDGQPVTIDSPHRAMDLGISIIYQEFNLVPHLSAAENIFLGREPCVSVIYISHRLEEIFAIADRVTVFRDGRHIATRPIGELDRDEIIRMMVGRELKESIPKQPAAAGDVVLEARGLTREGAFRDISFSVRRGEVVGLGGLVGAGRTEVARALFGADPLDAGEIRLEGRPVRIHSPRDAIALGIGLVPEDRKLLGLVLGMAVRENGTRS